MTNSSFDLIGSLKGDLENEFSKKGGNAQSHEKDPATLTFMYGTEEHTFPYTQIRHMKRIKERIVVSTYTANITVKGRRLEPLFSQLRRYKIAVITKSEHEEEEQVFIESISVIYNSEEDNHA